jgi:phospholipid/cholesterol/gamma-HCH transport system permease protein
MSQDASERSEQAPTTRESIDDARQAMEKAVTNAADLVRYCARSVAQIPMTFRLYPSEVFAQAGILIRGSGPVIVTLIAVLSVQSAVGGHYIFDTPGLNSYAGAIYSVALMRGLVQVVFGWIVAAKIGCGVVAELGSMKINEEVDALEVMGINPVQYLASTRAAAGIIVVPFLFATGLLVEFLAGYVGSVLFMKTVSAGGFFTYLYLFQNFADFAIALTWAFCTGVMCILVATYYGTTASGGPVGVGQATARSMVVNLVLISTLAVIFAQVFYGGNANAPIGN